MTINIWTPANSPTNEALPVLVFTHGGGYISRIGEAYDGAALAEDAHIVVVTYNYRLGQLGYLAHPALAEAAPEDGTGNYAVLDTIAALRWVNRNIAGFGNEYVNEILFVRGVLPTTPATETDAAAIVDLGARMINANRDRSGRTFTGDARPGRSTWVYRRENRPCRRCGTLIRGGTLGADPTRERIVFWCPTCQR